MDALAFRPNPQPWGQKQKHTLFASLASSTTRQQKSRETHTTELCILRQLSISYTPARMRVVDRAETSQQALGLIGLLVQAEMLFGLPVA
jgi:hypothetical protein